MATVQKTISDSGRYTTQTYTTTIAAPGIRNNAEISVSPGVDAGKISCTINETAETITVTLTNVGYTSYTSRDNWYYLTGSTSETIGDIIYLTCRYENGTSFTHSFPVGTWEACNPSTIISNVTYYFKYTITVTYKTFPEFKARQGGQLKTASDGWVRVGGQLKQIQQIWVRANGQLKEI